MSQKKLFYGTKHVFLGHLRFHPVRRSFKHRRHFWVLINRPPFISKFFSKAFKKPHGLAHFYKVNVVKMLPPTFHIWFKMTWSELDHEVLFFLHWNFFQELFKSLLSQINPKKCYDLHIAQQSNQFFISFYGTIKHFLGHPISIFAYLRFVIHVQPMNNFPQLPFFLCWFGYFYTPNVFEWKNVWGIWER